MNSSTLKTVLITMTTSISLIVNAQDNLDRTKRPDPLKTPKVQLPKIQKAKLTNGLNVWLVEHHELPVIAFNLVIQAGSDHDPIDKPGIATMTADVLDEGTTTRDALKIADELEFIGASLGVRSDADGSYLTLNTITKRLDEALSVYADVLVNPTFPQKEFERLRKQRQTALLQQKDRPPAIASIAFNHIVYGSNHPYGNDASGTEKSLNAMTREDLLQFYNSYYRPNNATLIIVGDGTLGDITKRLEKLLAGWKSAPTPTFALPSVPIVDKRRLYLIDKPGAAQSEIRIGYPAAARNTPDFFPLSLMNRALGGQFSSRLNLNLREKHGFTYGARSGFSFNKQPGPFVASSGVTTAKTDSSLREFTYEIDRMHNEGLTTDELSFVKKGFAGNFALNFETPGQIAGAMQNIVLYNLPENYYETYLQNIDKVTLDEVNKVSKKYLDSSRMAFVVVGDVKVIREGSEKLALGETVLCDTEGNRITQ
jgi:zinc protease